MTVSISSIKADAKKALKGNWLMAIISGLTLLFLYLIIQNTASLLAVVLGEIWAVVIMFVLSLLLFCPLIKRKAFSVIYLSCNTLSTPKSVKIRRSKLVHCLTHSTL